jgi:membrane protease YdiL (CAAX protease family)
MKTIKENVSQLEDSISTTRWAEGKGVSFGQLLFIILICIGITTCEYIFAYYNVAYGIVIALALSLIIYILLSIRNFTPGIVSTAESLALIPLYILFTSSMPWFFINQQYLLPAVYSCILGLCAWYIYQQNVDVKSLFGFRKKRLLRNILYGTAIGLITGVAEYAILHPAPTAPSFEVKYFFRDIIYMLLFVGLAEETLFRGLIQRNLTAAFGWKWGLLGASVLFAIMHLTWRSVPELLFVFAAGLIMGLVYWKTKELTMPIIIHCMNNVMLVAIAPYLFK